MAMPYPPPSQQPPPPPPQSSSQKSHEPFVSPSFGVPTSPPLQPQQQPQMQFAPQYPPQMTEPAGDDSYAFKTPDPTYKSFSRTINIRYQILLDAVTPYRTYRWAFSLTILLLFMIRVVVAHGWYVICYGLSIYYLNLFIGFLSPKVDPADGDNGLGDMGDLDSGPMLPTRANDEFRPFIRRLPEFKFWLSATKATLISLFLTLFEIFDLPVFWPILLLYFILLFISTMRQQIKHMLRYGYVPWDKGKKKYGARNESNSTLFGASDY